MEVAVADMVSMHGSIPGATAGAEVATDAGAGIEIEPQPLPINLKIGIDQTDAGLDIRSPGRSGQAPGTFSSFSSPK